MKIVVLDSYTLNPGDLNWDALRAMGDLVLYDRSTPEQALPRMQEAEIVLTNKAPITREAVHQSPQLKYIGVLATGYNVVDVQAASEHNITVSNVPAYGTASVAQHTFALIHELASHTGMHAQSVRSGDWSAQQDFSYWRKPILELDGKTLGIIGLGKIGQQVARIALAMGMKVIASHPHPERDRMEGVSFVDLNTCFRDADIVSLHCPLNDQNKGFVNDSLLSIMKRSAFLINVSRGPLINERDLDDALNSERIAGAGLDVLSQEPPPPHHPLLTAKNCIITPHIAWASQAARQRLMDIAVQNVQAFLSGKPQNVVNKKND
ncbi:MAG: D-2-hydroxyacid dehydrogenase [Cyclobacteriaceae bacterium]|nr:D-2-hydroxyacid dehydrogenase [Cyclobacteriaceae bacterium]